MNCDILQSLVCIARASVWWLQNVSVSPPRARVVAVPLGATHRMQRDIVQMRRSDHLSDNESALKACAPCHSLCTAATQPRPASPSCH